MNNNLNDKVIDFLNNEIEKSIALGKMDCAALDSGLLSLYQKGLVDLYFDETGELMAQITPNGVELSNINFAESFSHNVVPEA